eukprot:9573207-Alexandrium_andersonii.AAC.1
MGDLWSSVQKVVTCDMDVAKAKKRDLVELLVEEALKHERDEEKSLLEQRGKIVDGFARESLGNIGSGSAVLAG